MRWSCFCRLTNSAQCPNTFFPRQYFACHLPIFDTCFFLKMYLIKDVFVRTRPWPCVASIKMFSTSCDRLANKRATLGRLNPMGRVSNGVGLSVHRKEGFFFSLGIDRNYEYSLRVSVLPKPCHQSHWTRAGESSPRQWLSHSRVTKV